MDIWREQSEAAARVMDAWKALAESFGTTSGAAQGSGDQWQALTRGAADYAAAALRPVRDLVEGQREFADNMTRWAQLQRELADNMTEWAAQQREYADVLDRLLDPLSLGVSASTKSAADSEDR